MSDATPLPRQANTPVPAGSAAVGRTACGGSHAQGRERPDEPTPGGLRSRLVAERDRARDRAESLTRQFDAIVEATVEENTDDEHDPEGATIGFERAQVVALRRQAYARVAELDAALGRLDTGDYGRCERCGGQIPHDRLLARPDTRWCRGCAD